MKVIFLGTSEFAVTCLKAITQFHDVIAVVTQPDRPVGRKQIFKSPPVKIFAVENSIPVFQYEKISKEGINQIRDLRADIIVTASYGQILSKEVLESTPRGVYNIHASLLPKYRGASPIQAAILNGDKTTGITILKSGVGIDDGPILLKKELDIKEGETSEDLFTRLSLLGGECITEALELIEKGRTVLTPQDESKATYAKIIKKEKAKIYFDAPAKNIVNMVRAYLPWPVAYTLMNGAMLQIYKARKLDEAEVLANDFGALTAYENGEVVSCNPKNGFIVKVLDSFIYLLEIKPQNGKRMSAKDFLNGKKVFPNMILGE